MITKSIRIYIKSGLEAGATAKIVQIASQYDSSIYVKSNENKYNAKSIMGMMSLGLKSGEEIALVVDGADEREAVNEIEQYLLNVQ